MRRPHDWEWGRLYRRPFDGALCRLIEVDRPRFGPCRVTAGRYLRRFAAFRRSSVVALFAAQLLAGLATTPTSTAARSASTAFALGTFRLVATLLTFGGRRTFRTLGLWCGLGLLLWL